MFYIHREAKMYTPQAILKALSFAVSVCVDSRSARSFPLSTSNDSSLCRNKEFPFIFITAVVFTVMFYFILGFSTDPDKFFLFFAFVFLGLCSFTFLGQMMVSLFRDSQTAQGFGGLIVSFSALFSGILIRPGESFSNILLCNLYSSERLPNFGVVLFSQT